MRWASLGRAWILTVIAGLPLVAWAAPGDPLVVSGDGVNIRTGPGVDNSVLLRVYRNEPVVEVAREGEWIQIKLPERGLAEGWIHQSLVTAPGGAAVAPAPEPAAAPDTTTAPEPETAPAIVIETPAPAEVAVAPPATEPAAPAAPLVEAAPEVAAAPAEPAAGPGDTSDGDTVVAAAPPAAADGAAAPAAEAPQQVAATTGGAIDRFRESVRFINERAVAAAGIELFTDVRPGDDGTVQVVATDAWANVPEGGQQSFMNTLLSRWLAAAGGTGALRVQVVDANGLVVRESSTP